MICTATKTRRIAAATAAATAMIATSAAMATAAGDTSCSNTMAAKDLSGNLVVPAGAECIFTGGLVTGNVVVKDGAYLSLQGSQVRGNITASGTSNVSIDAQSTVSGTITMDRSDVAAANARTGGVLSIHASRVGAIEATGLDGAAAGLVDVRLQANAVVSKSVNASLANVTLATATVRGDLNVTGGGLGTVSIQGSKLYGSLASSEAQNQIMCGSSVTGSAAIEDAAGLYAGTNPAPNTPTCSGTWFKSDLTVNGSNLAVLRYTRVSGMTDGIMNGQVVLKGNNFSGGASGDFAS